VDADVDVAQDVKSNEATINELNPNQMILLFNSCSPFQNF